MEENNTDNTKEAFEVAKFIGIVGFSAGFVGPAIVSPASNQGPLFGIIISGPLSFIYGLFVGFLTRSVIALRCFLLCSILVS